MGLSRVTCSLNLMTEGWILLYTPATPSIVIGVTPSSRPGGSKLRKLEYALWTAASLSEWVGSWPVIQSDTRVLVTAGGWCWCRQGRAGLSRCAVESLKEADSPHFASGTIFDLFFKWKKAWPIRLTGNASHSQRRESLSTAACEGGCRPFRL